MQGFDIREYKKNLRKKYKNLRISMLQDEKAEKDNKIFSRLIQTREYREAKTILPYVSTDIEVDTKKLIEYSLANSKSVAVPYCVENSREMDFYLIKSPDDLKPRTFGVLEPDSEKCEKLTDFTSSICIVPALSYDMYGFRLGYGKGYYDRFLNRYNGKKIGICYESCITARLRKGRYDVACEAIITENRIIICNKQR